MIKNERIQEFALSKAIRYVYNLLTNKFLLLIIKTLVLTFSAYYIIEKILEYKTVFQGFNFKIDNLPFLIIALLLIPVNWMLEAEKWKLLTSKFHKVSTKQSIKTVLSAMVFGMITPARIGELGARTFYLPKQYRANGLVASFAGSLLQSTATLFFGLLALIALTLQFPDIQLAGYSSETLQFAAISLLVFGISILFFVLKTRLIWNQSFVYENFTRVLSQKIALKALLLSVLRYSVFLIQFYMLSRFFSVEITFTQAAIGLSLTYLSAMLIPVFTIVEISLRTALGVFYLQMFTSQIVEISAAISLLWIINVALPTIAGLFVFGGAFRKTNFKAYLPRTTYKKYSSS